MKQLHFLVGILAALLFAAGCSFFQGQCPPPNFCLPTPAPLPPTATPSSTPTPSPTPRVLPTVTPTQTPAPIVRALTSGRARIRISGIDKIGLDKLDSQAFLTACWDFGDLSKPCLELSLRGQSGEACLHKPCQDRAGVTMRFSPNPSYDTAAYHKNPLGDASQYLGSGIPYPFRVPLGSPAPDGSYVVTLSWDEHGPRVETDGGSAGLQAHCTGAVGLGPAVVLGVPHPSIGWSKEDWSATKRGLTAEVLSWEAVGDQGPIQPCP